MPQPIPALLIALAVIRPVFAPEALKLVQTIPLPDVEGRIDHMAADVKGQRLFVCALGNNTLEVVDLKAGRVAHTIRGLKEPQGCAYAPESNRLFVANGQGEGLDVYDGKTFTKLQQVKLGDDSDNVRYDADRKEIAVGYGSGAIAFIDAASGKRRGEVRLDGHPESFQVEPHGNLIYVNIPGAHRVDIVNRQKGSLDRSWSIELAEANFPMALDTRSHLAYVGCRMPPLLLAFHVPEGRLEHQYTIDADTDDIYCDAQRHLVYVSCGAGYLDAIDLVSGRPAGRIRTAPGARTSLFVPELNRLYVAIPHRVTQRAEIRVYEAVP